MSVHNISVIIPTYNREALIGRALDSVMRQSVLCGEIIVVDDGSTDDTAEVVNAFSQKTPGLIRYLRQLNRGPAAARNLGIAQTCHEFIAFLDSDDHWHKRKLEKQVAAMIENPEYLISHTWEKWLRNGKHLNQKKKHIPRHGNIFDHCLELCAVGMSTVMVRRKLFALTGLFDGTLPCCEDYDFWLRVSCRHPFLLLREPLTVKEGGREDQVSQHYRVGMDRFRIRALAKLLESGRLTVSQRRLTLEELAKKCTVYGKGCIKHGKVGEGEYYLNQAEVIA